MQSNQRLHEFFFPVWLLIFLPPMLLFTLGFSFITDTIVLLILLFCYKMEKKAQFYRKTILKAWFIPFCCQVFGALVLYFAAKIGHAFETADDTAYSAGIFANPFSSVLSFVTVLLVILFTGFIIYLFCRKWIFAKAMLDPRKMRMFCIIYALCASPWAFLLPYNTAVNLFGAFL